MPQIVAVESFAIAQRATVVAMPVAVFVPNVPVTVVVAM